MLEFPQNLKVLGEQFTGCLETWNDDLLVSHSNFKSGQAFSLLLVNLIGSRCKALELFRISQLEFKLIVL